MTPASRYIASALRYHPHYQSRSSMYISGLISRNLAELAEAVTIVNKNVSRVHLNNESHQNISLYKSNNLFII